MRRQRGEERLAGRRRVQRHRVARASSAPSRGAPGPGRRRRARAAGRPRGSPSRPSPRPARAARVREPHERLVARRRPRAAARRSRAVAVGVRLALDQPVVLERREDAPRRAAVEPAAVRQRGRGLRLRAPRRSRRAARRAVDRLDAAVDRVNGCHRVQHARPLSHYTNVIEESKHGLRLHAEQLELRARAAALAADIMVHEEACEAANGLPPEVHAAVAERVRHHRLNAINMPAEWGGQGLGVLDQVIVQEQLGQLTNALWDMVWRPANALRACDEAQRERYLLPGIRGERRDCVAVTERDAGSDPSAIATTAERVDGGFRDRRREVVRDGRRRRRLHARARPRAARARADAVPRSTRTRPASPCCARRATCTRSSTSTRSSASRDVRVGEDAVLGGDRPGLRAHARLVRRGAR